MKALIIDRFGGPEVLKSAELPDPEPGPGEVRVRVGAVAVARTKDVATRAGWPPFASQIPGFPHVLGTEHTGVVDAVGNGVDRVLVGRQVAVSAVLTCDTCRHCVRGREEACADFQLLGVHRRGSYAEYCVVPAANLTPLPRGVSLPEGATLAANGGVAAAQLAAGQVEPGANVLVVGAAGSLGSTVAALAAFRGARVIGLDRLGDDPDRLSGLPLAAAVDGGAVDLPARLRAAAGADGIDCIVDNLGIAALWEAYLPALAATGVVVMSGAISQDPVPLAFRSLYLHSQSVIGVRTGNRAHRDALWADVDAGFRPPPGFVHVTSWECSNEAHARIEAGAARGQIVLDVAMAPLRLGSA